eukprot:scaffold1456_cov118-Isochrysis_galbana.AAC.1
MTIECDAGGCRVNEVTKDLIGAIVHSRRGEEGESASQVTDGRCQIGTSARDGIDERPDLRAVLLDELRRGRDRPLERLLVRLDESGIGG